MKVGDHVCTEIALPGIPAGTRGVVREVGRLFLVIAFEDGRQGYYARRQLVPLCPCAEGKDSVTGEPVPLGVADARVSRGSHLCLFPSSRKAAINVTALYAAAGLKGQETVLSVAPRAWQTELLHGLSELGMNTGSALQRGQIRTVTPSEVYVPASRFVVRDQLESVATALSQALKDSPAGLRCLGQVGGRFKADGWWEYEERITPILKALGATALCVYDRGGLSAEFEQTATLVHTHVLRDEQLMAGGAQTY